MKPFLQLGLFWLVAQGVFAEQHGGAGGGAVGAGHAGSVAASHNAGHVHGSIRTYGSGHNGGYGYRGFYGGYYEPFDDSGYYPAAGPAGSNTTVVYPQARSAGFTETAHPVIHEYTQPEDFANAPGLDSGPILYLIAFRDNTIRAATTYWVEDGILHYLDRDHQQKQAPLRSVDRDLNAQLNRERHVPFNIQ